MERPRLLIVDDELSVRESLRMILKERYEPVLATSGEEALDLLRQERPEVILLDVLMPGMDGLETLERIALLKPAPPVIMLTATKTVKTAVSAMKLGAFDYITKPFDIDELHLQIDRAVQSAALLHEVEALRTEVGRRYSFDNIIGGSGKMQSVLKTVGMVAPLKTTVLITGESGTGKEVIAKAIHYNSPRASQSLVTLNCSAIPDNLLESELFGHERGAFTDAYSKKLGQFEHAHKGTIFLDEIGEMNPATQAKILRVLEQGTFTRVGGGHPVSVDVRVIAATNRDLQQGMRDGTFRSDLYYRLNVVAIHLPPLRERTEDLAPLIRHFLSLKSRELGVAEKPFNPEALDRLMSFHWPGNVRELENLIERALVLSQGSVMTLDDLPQYVVSGENQPHPAQQSVIRGERRLSDAVDQFEQELIRSALAEADFNQTRAAQILGTTRRILKYKMDKLGIVSVDKDPDAAASNT
ncbi:MAG: sigma-54-dependent Fis family transcriptional regulator [Deltaproteobacteria bacterium]|nr:sigma-54-dependent Fis family transcriptional regulator [Deltaproteobacteria bacterium]MBI3389720.1 sigma-54-dependent Fis family transcriptional regulator [Deltaproteobacteria bacterium]